MAPELQRRYPGARVCAWEPVARVVQNPERYGYGCLLPWYGVGQDRTRVDHVITRDNPLSWHAVQITPVYTPGHCKAHAAYILDFAGHRIAFTGDTIQSNGEVPAAQWIPCNESVIGSDSDITIAFEKMLGLGVTLNLGGHGSCFTNCAESYRAGLERARVFSDAAKALFDARDLIDAQRPRWFARLEIADA
jgi:glyoxylase-like metal-dependent hydrolase (beta-lactamase superfamily II)